MSRIGKKPVPLAKGVTVTVKDHLVSMQGPKGKLDLNVHLSITVAHDTGKNELVVTRPDDEKPSKALHGLTRSLLSNMVVGVTADLTTKVSAVDLVRLGAEALGGKGGGGRPDMAQAGGPDGTKAQTALDAIAKRLSELAPA